MTTTKSNIKDQTTEPLVKVNFQDLIISYVQKSLHWILAFSMLLVSAAVLAEDEFSDESARGTASSRVQDSLAQTWQSSNYELYIPVSTWHNRRYYDSDKIDEFNEQPWGLGIGKYRYDEDGDWHALYGMAFLDSHNKVEPLVGYGFQKMWHPTENVRLGAGYSVGITIRSDLHYIPIPIIVPLASLEYKKLAVQSTYIPGGNGNGNILFTWLRWQLQ